MTTYITLQQYFGSYSGSPEITKEHTLNSQNLLEHVNALLSRASASGVTLRKNPKTQSHISGTTDGGWRPRGTSTGAVYSSHKEGRGIDIYDPENSLDNWLTDTVLEEFGLYREHPYKTSTWVHLTTRAPKSGRRTFYP